MHYIIDHPFRSLRQDFDKIIVCSFAKVASSSFLHSLKKDYRVYHFHSLVRLRQILDSQSNLLIISGVRDLVARNISYLFQTAADDFRNDVKCRANNYLGEDCYIAKKEELLAMGIDKLIEEFFKKTYHTTPMLWMNEFFEIVDLEHPLFEKELGYSYFQLPTGNQLILYRMEDLPGIAPEFEKFFGIRKLLHTNDHRTRWYRELYVEFVRRIRFEREYLETLLFSDLMKAFYTDSELEKFFLNYKIRK